MRRVSPQRARALRVYAAKRLEFLEHNPTCARCGEWAFEVHHKAGRVGEAFLDDSTWLAMCHLCHRWVTEHPAQAIEQGYSLPRIGGAA